VLGNPRFLHRRGAARSFVGQRDDPPPAREMAMPSVVRNLKDRKVVQWALAYVAGAWLVLQVLDVLADVWALSTPVQQGVQLLLAAGLPLVLVLAWYHGERGRQNVSGPELLMIAALLGIGAGVLGIWRNRAGAPVDVRPSDAAAGLAASPVPAGRPSVAVLAFADMSPAGDQEYFADGIAEEILNALARVPGLQVAARTSAFSFKGSALDVRTIGRQLGVAALVEGSVRTEGHRVRITAQLIDVEDGFHLWSEEYDRGLESVFAVQEEIATRVARALAVELAPPESGGELPIARTTSAAYQTFLQGRHAFHAGRFGDALDAYARTAVLDPSFAPAHAGMASARYVMGHFGLAPYKDAVSIARREALTALKLDEASAEAHAVLGYIALYHDWDWATAEREVKRAVALSPQDAMVRHAYADVLLATSTPEESLRQVELGRDADPLSLLANAVVVGHLVFARRFEDALVEMDAIQSRFSGSEGLDAAFRAKALWQVGRRVEAIELWREIWSARDSTAWATAEKALSEGGPTACLRVWGDHLAARHRRGGDGVYEIAELYAMAGAREMALTWLERALEERAPSMVHVLVAPAFDGLRAVPRFRAVLRGMSIPG
jgi:TolB-like protein